MRLLKEIKMRNQHKTPNFGTLNLNQAQFIDRTCAKKRPYPNKNVALTKAREAKNRSGEDIEAYKCNFAGHYHIGHRKGSRV